MSLNKNLKKNDLLKLLDLDFFQKIQDRLSEEFNIASVITDIDGNPLTKTSNFSSFCMNYVRKSEIGFNNCKACDALGGFSAKKHMKPVIYTCHTGLTDFASPIIVGEKLVGCFLCGQILTNNLSISHFQKIAKKLNLNHENYEQALKELRLIPLEKIEYFANFLFEISIKISDFSNYQNIGNRSSHSLEEDFNKLFSIIADESTYKKEKSYNLLKKKLKLLFSSKNINDIDSDLVISNINSLEDNFSFIGSKLKNFNKKFKNFKI